MGRLLTVPTVTSDDDAHRVISPEQQMAHHSHAPAATARASFARARPHNARPVSYAARAAPDFRRESPPTCRESACGLARTSTRIPAHSPCVMGEILRQRPALTSQGVKPCEAARRKPPRSLLWRDGTYQFERAGLHIHGRPDRASHVVPPPGMRATSVGVRGPRRSRAIVYLDHHS